MWATVCVCSTAALGFPSCDSASSADVHVFTVGLFYGRLQKTHKVDIKKRFWALAPTQVCFDHFRFVWLVSSTKLTALVESLLLSGWSGCSNKQSDVLMAPQCLYFSLESTYEWFTSSCLYTFNWLDGGGLLLVHLNLFIYIKYCNIPLNKNCQFWFHGDFKQARSRGRQRCTFPHADYGLAEVTMFQLPLQTWHLLLVLLSCLYYLSLSYWIPTREPNVLSSIQ